MSLNRRKVGLSSIAAPRSGVNVNILNANLGTIETTLNGLVGDVGTIETTLNGLGYWQTPGFLATDYSAWAGVHTVTEADVKSNKYCVIGKTLFWNLFVDLASLSVSAQPFVRLPGGLVSAAYAHGFAHCINAGVVVLGMYDIFTGSSVVTISAGTIGTPFNLGVDNIGYGFSLVVPVQ